MGNGGEASRTLIEIIAAAAVSASAMGARVLFLLASAVMSAALIPSPALAADDTLRQLTQQLQRFPFQPDCVGNTQEIVACLWRQRNQDDATLQRRRKVAPFIPSSG